MDNNDLTTILLINVALHDEIRRRGTKFNLKRRNMNLTLSGCTMKAIEAENANLQKTFEEDMRRTRGEDEYTNGIHV